MNKLLLSFALSLLPSLALAQIRIVTTTTDFADLARQIGKEKVTVHSVMKGPENAHNVMARPTEMLELHRADLFVHSGLDAEPWRDNLVKGARNSKVLPGQPGEVDMSDGIDLKEVPQGKVDRSMGDVHAYGNPHYHLDPRNAQRMALTLTKALCRIDPADADFYKANARTVITALAAEHKQLLEELKPFGKLKVVTFHAAWIYFEDAFGIDVVATIEPKPMITPSAAQMRKTIELMKQQGVKVVVVETYNSLDQAKWVAAQAGAIVVVLPDHVNGLPEAASYQDLFKYDVSTLIKAARETGVTPAKE